MFSFFWWRLTVEVRTSRYKIFWSYVMNSYLYQISQSRASVLGNACLSYVAMKLYSVQVMGSLGLLSRKSVVCLPCCLDNGWEPVNLLLYIVYETDCVKQLSRLLENFIFRATTCERNFICCECEQNRKPGVDVSVRLRCMEAVKQCTAADAGNSSQAAHWSQVGHILLLFSGYIS